MPLQRKSTVIWDVCPALEAAQDTISRVYLEAKGIATVTSARDSDHSKLSAHSRGWAIDLRISTLFPTFQAAGLRTWYERLLTFTHELALALERMGGEGLFYAVLERDHIHLEWAPKGVNPNIKGFRPEIHVYTTSEVKAFLSPKAGA